MPPPSEAALRYAIIDRCLTNPYKPFPTMDVLKWEIERELKTSVSTATIQKDIAQMKKGEDEGGYSSPIKFKRSNQGYYYDLDKFPDYTIRAFGLNDKEIEAIELAAGVLKQFRGIKINDTFNHAIDKLYSAVNIKKTSNDNILSNAIQPQETTFMRGMEHFEVIVNSIKNKKPLSLIHYSYKNKNKKFKALVIHPYLLKESNDRWYLVGYSELEEHKKNPIRCFGLDRIYDPVMIAKEFIENREKDLRTLFDNKIGLYTLLDNEVEEPEEIKLWVSDTMANYVKSMPLHKTQVPKEHDGNGEIIITLNIVPTTELMSLIMSYGEHMELIKPRWLRKKMEEKINLTVQKYRVNRRYDK
jgi:predicted DNA-binding transcriptional regulator YafY